MKIYKSNSVEDTASAAGELAAELKPGDVIALVGDWVQEKPLSLRE